MSNITNARWWRMTEECDLTKNITNNVIIIVLHESATCYCEFTEQENKSAEGSVQVWWEQEVSGGFIPCFSPTFCLLFWDVGCGARSPGPVLLPLQGSSLTFIYIRDANHTDTLAAEAAPVSGGFSTEQRSGHPRAHSSSFANAAERASRWNTKALLLC